MPTDVLRVVHELVDSDGPAGQPRRRAPGPLLLVAVLLAAALAVAGGAEVITGGAGDGTAIRTAAPALASCRNSNDPACGAFRFDPRPGADAPKTVQVTVEPASPQAGRPMVFHVALHDPDGVSYGSSLFGFGGSGIGDSTVEPCAKFGAWDPPAPDPSAATKVVDVAHTYPRAGMYTATFSFEAGPFDCVDGASGRGDRPYASSATGTVTFVVR